MKSAGARLYKVLQADDLAVALGVDAALNLDPCHCQLHGLPQIARQSMRTNIRACTPVFTHPGGAPSRAAREVRKKCSGVTSVGGRGVCVRLDITARIV